jgi:hypothetical protein
MLGRSAFMITIVASLGATCLAQGDELAAFSPSWLEYYNVGSGRADPGSANDSYLGNRNVGLVDLPDPLTSQLGSLIDRGSALQWRQQYEDMNRDYDQRSRAGLSNPTVEQAHLGAMSDFSNHVRDEIENRKLQRTGDEAVHVVEKDEIVRTALVPGAVAAGLWIGRPVSLRLTEDMKFSFRTSIRDHFSAVEFHSPFLFGSFEYHSQAADNYTLIAPTNVDFTQALDFNHIVDFGAEKYQFKVVRQLPIVDLNGTVFYGSSSNVVASSLTKQLTPNLAAVVDSIYYLSPYDPDHVLEERLRLKYDIHF